MPEDADRPMPDERVPEVLPLVPVPDALRDEISPFRRRDEESGEAGETFRVGELARRSGVAIGTIKFYLREGLLPHGEPTAKTQALYTTDHLRRLRIIRVLSDIGGLTLAQIRAVIDVIDDDALEPGDLSQMVSYALAASGGVPARRGKTEERDRLAARADARAATDAFIDAIGLVVDEHSPARDQLGDAYAALVALGLDVHPIVFTEHARLAYELAQFEIGTLGAGFDDADTASERQAVDEVVVGTVVFGAAFAALRALAHEHEARRRLANASRVSASSDPAPRARDQESL